MAEGFIVRLPKLGESIVSATVIKWLKEIGNHVEKDEPILEVSTDKVNSEIPSPVSGILVEKYVQLEEVVEVDQPLVKISTEPNEKPKTQDQSEESFFSPAVMRLAKENHISLEELQKIPTSHGRLSKKDLQNYIDSKQQSSASSTYIEGHQRIKMSQMRKQIADNMVKSFYGAPHATVITEVDVTDVLNLIQKEKEAFLSKNHAKLSITSFVARAICKAIKEFPLINSSLDDDTIIVKQFVNLGFAVHVENGLQVPVIKTCHSLGLSDIAKQIAALAQKARSNQLALSDVSEGTITLTNYGMTGTTIGIPIIRYPEVAIIGLGAIVKRVAVMEDDQTEIRQMVNVSLTFDHRVLDGIYGCQFLNQIKSILEKDLLID